MPAGGNMQNCNNYSNSNLSWQQIKLMSLELDVKERGERKRTVAAAPLTQFKWLANVSTAFFDKCAKRRRFYAKRK